VSGGGATGGTGSGMGGAGGTPEGGVVPPCWGICGRGCREDEKAFAPSRIWLLSDDQYVNVVRDVLGIALTGTDTEIMGPVIDDGEYRNESEGLGVFTDMMAANYMAAAEKVAGRAIEPDRMLALVGSTTPTDAAVMAFIENKVARLWRRPLTASDVSRLHDLYAMGLVDGARRGIELVLETALQAPAFLFRTELGSGNGSSGAVVLNVYEQASALSFMLTNTAPDDELWQTATNGTLSDPAVLATQVDRLLSLDVTKDQIARYASYWLTIEKVGRRTRDAALFPEFDPALHDALRESGRAFVRDVVLGGSLVDLFTSRTVYVNESMGAVYGLPGAAGPTLVPVTASGSERSAGILTQPATFVSTGPKEQRTDPIHRGLFVLETLLCGGDVGEIPPPRPEDLDVAAKMTGDERELALKRSMLSCSACHGAFDFFGLTMERYDAIGRYSASRAVRRNDAIMSYEWITSPTPIDESATIPPQVGADLQGRIEGVAGLASLLAGDKPRRRVAFCAGARLARYALGYDGTQDNTCTLYDVKERFFQSGSFVQFYKDLATSPGFTMRRPQ
jgi:hypothetical protein